MVRRPPVSSSSALVILHKIQKKKFNLNELRITLTRKSQNFETTHGKLLSLFSSQYWNFMKFITLSIYRFPILLSAKKEGFKDLWTWCFPCTSGAAPVSQPGTTQFITVDQTTEPLHAFITFLIVFPTPTCTLKWSCTVSCTSIIERAKLQISLLVLKYATKFINLLSKGT